MLSVSPSNCLSESMSRWSVSGTIVSSGVLLSVERSGVFPLPSRRKSCQGQCRKHNESDSLFHVLCLHFIFFTSDRSVQYRHIYRRLFRRLFTSHIERRLLSTNIFRYSLHIVLFPDKNRRENVITRGSAFSLTISPLKGLTRFRSRSLPPPPRASRRTLSD